MFCPAVELLNAHLKTTSWLLSERLQRQGTGIAGHTVRIGSGLAIPHHGDGHVLHAATILSTIWHRTRDRRAQRDHSQIIVPHSSGSGVVPVKPPYTLIDDHLHAIEHTLENTVPLMMMASKPAQGELIYWLIVSYTAPGIRGAYTKNKTPLNTIQYGFGG